MKPNHQQIPDHFDEVFVYNQLKSSGTIAYYNLMNLGYPIKISIAELFEKLQPYLEQRHISFGANNCCQIYLLANGFESNEFKFGKTEIHIRPGKLDLLNRMNAEFQEMNNEIAVKFKKRFIASIRRSLFICIRFCGAGEAIDSEISKNHL